MKKILTFSAIALFSFVKSQITLEHTFTPIDNQYYRIYSNGNDTFYYIFDNNDKNIKIYNSDYSLRKVVNVNVPTGYKFSYTDYDYIDFTVTKNLINTDDFYEFFVYLQNEDSTQNSKFFVINENGDTIYDFGTVRYNPFIKIFNDKVAGKNKLYVYGINIAGQRIYSLPTTALSIQELENISSKNAYPNPASSEVNIPLNSKQNGILKVYNSNGQIMETKSINSREEYYKLPLGKYQTGVYFYEYNGDKGKFIVK